MSGQLMGQTIFGSKSKAVVLEEVAKAVQPVSAYAIARVSGLDPKNIYEECAKLYDVGLFQSIPTGKNQSGYLYSDSEAARKLLEFVQIFATKQRAKLGRQSVIEKLATLLPMTDYYVSLPLALRISFDVFYSPNYILIFVDRRDKSVITKLRKSLQSKPRRNHVIIKAISLWGREFKYDEVTGVSLASNEQSIADGLNYYEELRDREVIRTLLTRTLDFDLRKVRDKLNYKGTTRLCSIIAVKNKLSVRLGAVELQVLDLLRNRKKILLDEEFKSDLANEVIPALFPNDQAYGDKETFSTIASTASKVLKSLA